MGLASPPRSGNDRFLQVSECSEPFFFFLTWRITFMGSQLGLPDFWDFLQAAESKDRWSEIIGPDNHMICYLC